MKKYLKINNSLILREEDSMLFSAKNMQIYKFNDKGFDVVKTIIDNKELTKDDLYAKLKDNYTEEELNNLLDKMINTNIVEYYE